MVKAVIFDLDDLMVDHYKLHAKAADKVLKRYGYRYDQLPLKKRRGYIGMRVREVVRDFVDYFKLTVSPQDLYKERMKIFLGLVKEKVIPRPGIFKAVSLFEKMKLRLAVASSGPREYIDVCLRGLRVKDKFEVIVSGDDVKKGKPNSETYRKAIKKLGLKPEECLVLEDAEAGVAAAKKAGAWCVGVMNANTEKQDLSKADLVVESLEEIDEETLKRFNI
jgi:beta-phosphoglucomutase-like phosphatase (HAD superfamily)